MAHQLLTISHHVARITLHHPPANVLNLSVLKELEQVLIEVEEDEYVRVVIVTGTGRFFCAGADLHELAHLTTVHGGAEFALRGQSLFSRIERSQKPVLVAINGTCLGGGLELALACHIRVAAAGALLGLPEIKLGLIPGFGGTQRLPRVVGGSKAAEMILTGESLSAEEALRIGLVSRVVPPQELLAQAEAIAALMTARGTGRRRSGAARDQRWTRHSAIRRVGQGSGIVRPVVYHSRQGRSRAGVPRKAATKVGRNGRMSS